MKSNETIPRKTDHKATHITWLSHADFFLRCTVTVGMQDSKFLLITLNFLRLDDVHLPPSSWHYPLDAVDDDLWCMWRYMINTKVFFLYTYLFLTLYIYPLSIVRGFSCLASRTFDRCHHFVHILDICISMDCHGVFLKSYACLAVGFHGGRGREFIEKEEEASWQNSAKFLIRAWLRRRRRRRRRSHMLESTLFWKITR